MNILLVGFRIFAWCVWAGVSLYLVLLAASSLPQLPIPQLSYNTYVITSGSMEPTIMTGDLIFSKSQSSYTDGDIVTFQEPGHPTITHRIIERAPKDPNSFITKGDNNEDPDTTPMPKANIKGKYQLTLPKIGYVLVYSRSPLGLIVLIGLPSIVLALESVVGKKPKRTASPDES